MLLLNNQRDRLQGLAHAHLIREHAAVHGGTLLLQQPREALLLVRQHRHADAAGSGRPRQRWLLEESWVVRVQRLNVRRHVRALQLSDDGVLVRRLELVDAIDPFARVERCRVYVSVQVGETSAFEVGPHRNETKRTVLVLAGETDTHNALWNLVAALPAPRLGGFAVLCAKNVRLGVWLRGFGQE